MNMQILVKNNVWRLDTMEATEAIQCQIVRMPNLKRNMTDLVQAVSIGVMEKGLPGSRAVEYQYGVYNVTAKYENVTGPPHRADVETKHRVFWDKESMNRLEILLQELIEENKPFVTRTGDGSGENPFITLKWEREIIAYARH